MSIPPSVPPPNNTNNGASQQEQQQQQQQQLLFSPEDDFSYYYSLFQESNSGPFSLDMPVGGKRRRRGMAGEDGEDEPQQKHGAQKGSTGARRKKKKVAITQLLTSIVAMEEQEKAERDQFDAENQQELALLDANHREKTQSMLDYYSNLQDHYSDLDESDAHRVKGAHAASASAAASTASAAAATAGSPDSAQAGQQHQHQRRLWVKDRSKAWWDRCSHPDFPEEEFRAAFRMGRATFDLICDELGSAVAKEDTMLRAAIPVRQRVAVCIWRLATGEPLRLVSKRFGLGISTCHKLVLEVCSAIKTVLMPKFLQWPSDPESSRVIMSQFESTSKIPNIIGSMYTTHIPIIAPKISVAAYFNKRHTERNQKTSYSITVQGVVDPDGVFTDICIGWPGSMPDDQVLEKSALCQRATAGLLKNQWIVGSSGYPLLDWVLVPYAHQNLTWTQHAFNEKIGEVQRVASEAFARLKGRWKCLQKRTEVKLLDLPVVLGACCVLHNVCELRKEQIEPDLRFELKDDEMVPENPLRSAEAMQARDSIAHNLLHHGLAGTTFF